MERKFGKSKIEGLDGAKFLLIVGVFLGHSNILTEVASPMDVPETSRWIIQFFSHALIHGIIAGFLLFSGFLFFRGIAEQSESTRLRTIFGKMKRRILTLLVPYLLWNLIGAIVLAVKHYRLGMSGFNVFNDEGFNFLYFVRGFWDVQHNYPYDFVLWFLRDLIIYIALAPLIYYISKSHIMVLLSLVVCSLAGQEYFHLFYFIAGGWFGYYDVNLKYISKPYTWIPSTVVWISMALLMCVTELSERAEDYVLLTRDLAMVAPFLHFGRYISRKTRWGDFLISSTFFIYAFHGLYCSLWRKVIIHIFGLESNLSTMCAYITIFITLVGSALLAYYVMRKLFPTLTSILSGGR